MVEEQAISLLTNLTAAGVTAGTSVGATKVREVLRRRDFSEELHDVATEFSRALETAIRQVDAERDTGELTDVAEKWDIIVTELAGLKPDDAEQARERDQIALLFKDESDAISQIAEAIALAEGFDLDQTPELRRELESAVRSAYRQAMADFERRIAGTDLADVFQAKTNLVLNDQLTHVQDRLIGIEGNIQTLLTQEVKQEGFVELRARYFAQLALEAPETCWQTGFNFAEVRAGYHFERNHPDDQDQRATDHVFEQLRNGKDLVVTGPPGSGKSTICKSVACQWYEADYGPVFYRESSGRQSFERPGALEGCIQAVDGTVLVVVEDAARPESSAIFHLIERFRGDDDVIFLLDSQQAEWENAAENLPSNARLEIVKNRHIERYQVLNLTERECIRAIDQFEETTGQIITQRPEQLAADLSSTPVGDMYLLAYRLASDIPTTEDGSTTVLEESVDRVYRGLSDRCSDREYLPFHLGILVNVLNAAGMHISRDILHALAEGRDDHRRIDELIQDLRGDILFEGEGAFRTHHPLWSSVFFRHFLKIDPAPADHFEDVVNALFSLVDNPRKRERIRRRTRGDAPFIEQIESDPEAAADALVLRIFNMGDTEPRFAFTRASGNRRQPVFHVAPLFRTTDYSYISLPEACSEKTRLRCINLRGVMYLDAGEFDTAQEEFEQLREELRDADDVFTPERLREVKAWTLNNLGNVARRRGDLEGAEEYHNRGHELFRAVKNDVGEAWTLNNLANVYRLRGELDEATRFHERSLSMFEAAENDLGRGWVLNNLGLVARLRGDFDTAATRHERALEVFQDLDYRLGEARALNALGLVERERENYEKSLSRYRWSLKVSREIGDRQCIAWCLNNLGTVHERRGALIKAHDHYRESLGVKRDLGDRKGEANTLSNLASVALRRGNLNDATTRAETCVERFREIGLEQDAVEALEHLAELARDADDPAVVDAGQSWCETAIELTTDEARREMLETLSRELC